MTDERQPVEDPDEADDSLGAAVSADLEPSADESEHVTGGGFRSLPPDQRRQIAHDT